MDIFTGYCLTVLEMTFLLSGLLILHGLRRILGTTPFYVALGMLLVFSQIAGAAGIRLTLGYPGLDYPLSSSVLTLPFLAILIVVYVADGTLMAQRIIIGMMAALGIYVYLMFMTLMQCSWPGYSISQGPGSEALAFLLGSSSRLMAATVVSLSMDLFLVPIIFQRLLNLKCRLFLTVLGSLMLVQLVDHLIFVTIAYWGTPQWWNSLTSSYLTRALFVVVISILTAFYLSRIEYETPGESRRTLDIILAFFGAYGKSLKLEQNLRETQERYRLLVQNASDMIVIMNADGGVIDANNAALRMFGLKALSDLIGHRFSELSGVEPAVWSPLTVEAGADPSEKHVISVSTNIARTGVEVDLSMIAVPYGNEPLLIIFGRDVTERRKLEREREEWNIQASHRQRLEAIGRLAGGIAHDFNNYIHAIQGHLDIILLMHDVQDEAVLRNLHKIDHITELAGTLTSQMLSFARKGSYQQEEIHLNSLAAKCAELFLPSTQSGISFRIESDPDDPAIMGDPIQLQQTLMNLMINAKDAMKKQPESEQSLTIRIGPPEKFGIKLDPPSDAGPPAAARTYRVVRVADTGPGIAPEIRNRIFEPFFTTKPVGEGTGMGLAMAYGTIIAHNGWIQVQNLSPHGAAFDIILPIIGLRKNPEEEVLS